MKLLELVPLSSGPFRIAIETSDDERAPLRMDTGDPLRSQWRAELLGAGKSSLLSMVLQVPDIRACGTSDSNSDAPHSMAELEKEWQRRVEELWQLDAIAEGEASGTTFRMIMPPVEDPSAAFLPPLVGTAEGLFAIPCPYCLRPLSTCRDESLLSRPGSDDPPRGWQVALVCSRSCTVAEGAVAEGAVAEEAVAEEPDEAELRAEKAEGEVEPGKSPPRPRLFVVEGPLPEDPPEPVGDLEDLLYQLRRTLGGGSVADSGDAADSADSGAELDPVSRSRAERLVDLHWTVVTDRELPYALMARGTLGFDRGLELLGGGGAAAEAPGDHLLFAYQGTGLDAVELLFLKLCLFQQALRSAHAYHQRLARPHLDLSPARLSLSHADLGSGLPRLWGVSLGLASESAARPRSLPNGAPWIAPPPRSHPAYDSPASSRARSIEEHIGQLQVERWVEEGEDRYRLEARLTDTNGIFPKPSETDWIRLRFLHPLPPGIHELMTRLDPRSFSHASSIAVTSEPLELDAAFRSRAAAFLHQDVGQVGYRVYPVLGIEEDLYSLGMLLLRLLLVNDQQDMGSILRILQSHFHSSQHLDPAERPAAEENHLQLISSHPDVFSPTNIFHAKQDRSESRPNPIPVELWHQAIHLALDLTLHTRGDGHSRPPASGEPNLRFYQDAMDQLIRQSRLLLFRSQPVHLEIHSVIAEMLTSKRSSPGPPHREPTH